MWLDLREEEPIIKQNDINDFSLILFLKWNFVDYSSVLARFKTVDMLKGIHNIIEFDWQRISPKNKIDTTQQKCH